MVERADSDGDGYISFEDFYNILTKKTFAWLKIIKTKKFIYFKWFKVLYNIFNKALYLN